MTTKEPTRLYALVVEGDGWCIKFQSKPEQGVTVTGRLPTLGEVRDTFSHAFPQIQMIVPTIVHIVMAEMHRHQAELQATDKETARMKGLLSDARIAGERMSEALGSDECTIPWDDAVMPRLKEFR